MTESKEMLQQSLEKYELQLLQITEAIANKNDDSYEELISLRSSIIELITLTKQNLNSLNDDIKDDPFAKEYELFQAELQNKSSNSTNDLQVADSNIQKELSYLIGSKCQAPFVEQWSDGSCTYHNALIMSIEVENSLDNIKVKVMFVNPTCQEMIPCQYFLSGECKFSDDQCHFSHGYIVYFSELKEYKEPNFNILAEKVAVLAKDIDNLWKRARVTAVIPELNQCSVKFESGRKQEVTIDIHNTLPLGESDAGLNKEQPSSIQSSYFEEELHPGNKQDMLLEKCSSQQSAPKKLGEWEQYTNGIGSKLMASMGYIVGSGLGKCGQGRVEPVVAVALPKGKSLDHCMALREAKGGDPNLFKVDNKSNKKFQRKRKKKKSSVVASTPRKLDLFTFMNNSLSGSSRNSSSAELEAAWLKKSTDQVLNVEEMKVSESISKKKHELFIFRDKLTRQKRNSLVHNTILKKIKDIEAELCSMQTALQNVNKEQSYRQTMKELTEF